MPESAFFVWTFAVLAALYAAAAAVVWALGRSTAVRSGSMGALRKVSLTTQALDYVRDPSVALWRKGMALFAALYVISPIDLIPDWIPVLGWLDDLGVVGLTAWFFLREIRKHAARQPPRP